MGIFDNLFGGSNENKNNKSPIKTALNEALIACNLFANTSLEHYKDLLNKENIKFIEKIVPPKDAYPGIKGPDGQPLKMIDGYTTIDFNKMIGYRDVPYMAVDQSGFQNFKNAKINVKFDKDGLFKSQDISLEYYDYDSNSTAAFDLFEPFLGSSLWEVVRKKKNPDDDFYRAEIILMQKKDKSMLLISNAGRVISFRLYNQLQDIINYTFK